MKSLIAALFFFSGLTAFTAQAGMLLVNSNVQAPSFAFDEDGDGSLESTEITNNDQCDNEKECEKASADCTSPDGLPDGNHDCLCQLSEAIVAANSDLPVDSCKPEFGLLFGEPDVIVLEEDGPYEFEMIDNVGDNLLNPGNGPNALPKITTFVVIEGNGNVLERVCEDKRIESTKDEILSRVNISLPRLCNFRLLETANFLMMKDLTARGFDPGCLTTDSGKECFDGGFLYVVGGFADLGHVVATDNQTSMTDATIGGAVFIDGSEGKREIGAADVSIHESILSENRSHAGGGIAAGPGSILTIDQTTISHNQALLVECVKNDDEKDGPLCDCDGICGDNEDDDCGDCAKDDGFIGFGGGIVASASHVTILESSIHDNRADRVGGGVMVFDIGDDRLQRESETLPFSDVKIINTTIAYNTAEVGAGIAFVSPTPASTEDGELKSSTFAISSSTIAGNGSDDPETRPFTETGGGIFKVFSTASMTLRNTIVADNIASEGADGHGLFTSQGHNHVADSSGFFMSPISGDLFDQPAGLNVWVDDNSLDVLTAGTGHFPLLATSLNVDSAGGADCPSIDQIQVNRDENLDFPLEFGECSKGAIEYDDVCGDGRLEPNNDEECDDGNVADGDSAEGGCSADCTLPTIPTTPEGSICGNGTVEAGESCDEGEAHNSNEPDAACRTDCRAQRCGDGIIDTEAGEGCDGGATCFDCTAEVVPSPDCGITAEELMDPALKTNGDLLDRFGYDAIAKCLTVFGGGPSCSLNPAARADTDFFHKRQRTPQAR